MHKHVVDFCTALYTVDCCDSDCTQLLLHRLPQVEFEYSALEQR